MRKRARRPSGYSLCLAWWTIVACLIAADCLSRRVSAADPVDQQARPEVHALLQRLRDRSQAKDGQFWIGQNFGHSGIDTRADFQRAVDRLVDESDRWPALLSVDYGWNQVGAGIPTTNRLLIEHARQNGMVMISVHWANPWQHSTAHDLHIENWDDLFRTDSPVHRRWRSMLDEVAAGLDELQKAGVPVLWRPFHEMNGNWFWWSLFEQPEDARATQFQRLWDDLYHYLTVDKQLHHLLWVYSPHVANDPLVWPVARMYPGNSRVDLVGCDYYGDPESLDLRDALQQLELLNKPRAICEFGFGHRVQQAQDNLRLVHALSRHGIQVTFVNYWHSWPESRMAIVDHERAKDLMHHPLVLTR